MTPKIDLGPVEQLPEGEVMLASAKETGYPEDIAVVHTEDDEFYALDDECSHQAVSLSDGWVEENTLECPMHASAFCLKTGVPETPPAITPVKTHVVTVEAGRLMLHAGTPQPGAAEA